MDPDTLAAEARVEATHWWFVGRRRLFERMIRRARVAAEACVLDIGTGTGANLRLLRAMGFGNVTGIDASATAVRYCAEKRLGEVRLGDVCALPFPAGSFDLVTATDVVEHVDDDARALGEIRRVLAPGGLALITVPAFRSLWGLQDDRSHHKRRYRRRAFIRLVESSGLVVERSFYFNYLLFAPILLARRLFRLFPPRVASENEINTPLLNRILGAVFNLDVASAPVLRPPFGVSILVTARPSGRPQPG